MEFKTYSDEEVEVIKQKALQKQRKEDFKDFKTLLFGKHYHKEIYVRYLVSGHEFEKLKIKLLKGKK